MNWRNKAILLLLLIGGFLYAVIQGVVIPGNEQKAEQYQREQQEPWTHDLKSVLPYKNPYMGNAGNVINLFAHLPLNELERTYELESDRFTVNLHYKEAAGEIGMKELKRKLLYNSLAAFALIDNLQGVHYHFTDTTLTARRADVERVFPGPLAELLKEERWQEDVQKKWADEEFLEKSVETVFGG
ncbi:hypothetical protein T458_23035 [Brevibacillus panacihumi W25]|uniref:DUF4825 domain-containing protein n=1 Tax=Brevibacillus panacihumi W25 TaxID=1408254 RepID=V6M508_9BACL|nr:DUF4825 domain-containing protein [Brevibacillus panacihumi]EST53644.1 hypothetical protein T458_23035 [Brevibacillus panacihumi W25]